MAPEDLARRIKAARLLRDISQDELAERLSDAGLPWRLAGQLERGEVMLKSAALAALSTALGFPQRWFTAPVDEICPPDVDVAVLERLNSIDSNVGEILNLLRK